MPKKVLIITDDSGESLEIYYAQHRFRELAYAALIAATKKQFLHACSRRKPGKAILSFTATFLRGWDELESCSRVRAREDEYFRDLARLQSETVMTLDWIAERLCMGCRHPVASCLKG